MKELTYNFVDKTKWGPGEWQEEPDKLQWTDEATGLPCLAVRNPRGGHWCGYVGVSKGHPFFEKEYSACARGCDGYWCEHSPSAQLSVHGGITFSSKCRHDEHGVCHVVEEGEDDDVWWLGFDCAHCGDFSPGHSSIYMEGTDYKTLSYVKREAALLAQQLKTIGDDKLPNDGDFQ